MQTLGSRRYGAINWIGLRTLYGKEVRRFWSVATQTVLAPLVTACCFSRSSCWRWGIASTRSTARAMSISWCPVSS